VGFGIQFGCHWNCEKEEEEEEEKEAEELWGLNFIEFFSHWVWILCMSGKEGGGLKSNPLRRLCITCGVKGISCSQRETKQRGCH
jgi:hypothetical protein